MPSKSKLWTGLIQSDVYEHCCTIEFSELDLSSVQLGSVYELTDPQKEAIFGEKLAEYRAAEPETKATLERLKQYSPSTAACFGSKAGRRKDFAFRLLSPHGSTLSTEQPSYIALSYRWAPLTGEHGLPVPPLLWNAVLRELRDQTEGLWADQFCIDQSNSIEKISSIGLMDMIYERARCIVVPLPDVKFTREERCGLEFIAHNYPRTGSGHLNYLIDIDWYPGQRPYHLAVYSKLVASEYFQRAWCSHEFRNSAAQVLLIPCAERHTIMRLSGAFLYRVMCLVVEQSLDEQMSPLAQANVIDTVFSIPIVQARIFGATRTDASNPLLEVFRSFGGFKAGGDSDPALSRPQQARTALRDKMAITLNSTGSGLIVLPESYRPSAEVEEDPVDEHFRKIQLLSLAQGEAPVLCCGGVPLPRVPLAESHSWLHRDWKALPNYIGKDDMLAPSQHIKLCPSDPDRYIELQVCWLPPCVKVPDRHWMARAGDIAQMMLGIRGPKPPFSSHWMHFFNGETAKKALFLSTFACVLELGINWILNSLSIQRRDYIRTENLQSALGQFRSQHDWIQDLITSQRQAVEPVTGESRTSARLEDSLLAMSYVLDFALSLLEDAGGSFHSLRSEDLQPYLVSLSEGGSEEHLVLLSSTQRRASGAARPLAIPLALLGDRSERYGRLWTIDWATIDGERQRCLLQQSCIFGPSLGTALVPELVRVYGPPVDPSSQLIHPGAFTAPSQSAESAEDQGSGELPNAIDSITLESDR